VPLIPSRTVFSEAQQKQKGPSVYRNRSNNYAHPPTFFSESTERERIQIPSLERLILFEEALLLVKVSTCSSFPFL